MAPTEEDFQVLIAQLRIAHTFDPTSHRWRGLSEQVLDMLEHLKMEVARARSEADAWQKDFFRAQERVMRAESEGRSTPFRGRSGSTPRTRSRSRSRSRSRERSRTRRRTTPPISPGVRFTDPVTAGPTESEHRAHAAAAASMGRDRPPRGYHLSSEALHDSRRRGEFCAERDRLSERFNIHSRTGPCNMHFPMFPWGGIGLPGSPPRGAGPVPPPPSPGPPPPPPPPPMPPTQFEIIPGPGDPLMMRPGDLPPHRPPMPRGTRDFIMRGGRDGAVFGHFR